MNDKEKKLKKRNRKSAIIFSSIWYKKNGFSHNVSRETFLMNQIGNVMNK